MFLEARWRLPVPPRIFWRELQEAPVPWLELGRKCCHVFGIVQNTFLHWTFLVHQCRWTLTCMWSCLQKDFGCCQFRYLWIHLFLSRVEAPGNTCQMNCTSWAARFNGSTNPCSFHTSSNLVAQLLVGCGFETPTHKAESENTWTFILISFTAGSLSRMFSSPAISA